MTVRLSVGPEQTPIRLRPQDGHIVMRRSPVSWLSPEDVYQLCDALVDMAESIERSSQE